MDFYQWGFLIGKDILVANHRDPVKLMGVQYDGKLMTSGGVFQVKDCTPILKKNNLFPELEHQISVCREQNIDCFNILNPKLTIREWGTMIGNNVLTPGGNIEELRGVSCASGGTTLIFQFETSPAVGHRPILRKDDEFVKKHTVEECDEAGVDCRGWIDKGVAVS